MYPIDVVPEFGFPLAMMAQFQLNLVIFRMDDVPEIANLKGEKMVLAERQIFTFVNYRCFRPVRNLH